MPVVWLLHAASVAPLVVLAVWFGGVDTRGVGELRCGGCGVEGYVTAAHLVAAAMLAAVAALGSALRERAAGRPARPDGRTLCVLGMAGALTAGVLAWPEPVGLYLVGAAIVAPFVALGTAVWWVLALRPFSDRAVALAGVIARTWVGLFVLLPGLYAWVWLSRVSWLVV